MEGFFFVGGAEAAAEVKDGIVVIQGQRAEEFLQLLEAVPDIRRVGFLILSISRQVNNQTLTPPEGTPAMSVSEVE